MARCAEVEKSALEKLGNIIVAATVDAEGAYYVERFSRQLAEEKRTAGKDKGTAAYGKTGSLGYWKEPQCFESGRIAAANAEKIGCQKWEPVQFPQNKKRKMGREGQV